PAAVRGEVRGGAGATAGGGRGGGRVGRADSRRGILIAAVRGSALLAVVALALAVRLLNLAQLAPLPTVAEQTSWREADMALAWEWSGDILGGALLGRDTPHQFTGWMQDTAPLATWERWWGGRAIFHQAPLYAYALAGMRRLTGDDPFRV